MNLSGRRRFYQEVTVAPRDGHHAILLDGRSVRTPQGRPLRTTRPALARAVAEEWRAQETEIRPHAMPLTRLLNTAIDRVAPARGEVIEHALAYAGTDLLCYRAFEPEDLVVLQTARWQPLIEWAAGTLGARLEVTAGIVPVPQPEPALAALRRVLEDLDDLTLTVVADVVGVAGSLVVAVALAAGRVDGAEAFEVSQLDETHQIQRWGLDAEAAARRAAIEADLETAERFLALYRDARLP